MGFQLPERHVEITWDEGTDYAGAVVTLSLEVPANLLFDFMELSDSETDNKETRGVYTHFGDVALVSWNIEDRHGVPVPIGGEGLLSLSFPFIAAIVTKWSEQVQVGDDDPLDGESSTPGGNVLTAVS